MCDAISSCKDDASSDELDTEIAAAESTSIAAQQLTFSLQSWTSYETNYAECVTTWIVCLAVLHIDSISAPQGGDVHRQHHSRDIPSRIIYASITAAHYNLQCHDSSFSGGAIYFYNTAVFPQEALLMPTILSTAETQVHTDGVMYQTDGNHAVTLSTHTQSTNDDVQPSFVLIFIAIIVMVYKITISSHCRNRNAALQGKEQLTLFQWVFNWVYCPSKQLVNGFYCCPSKQLVYHWFIGSWPYHINGIGLLSAVSKQWNWFIVSRVKTMELVYWFIGLLPYHIKTIGSLLPFKTIGSLLPVKTIGSLLPFKTIGSSLVHWFIAMSYQNNWFIAAISKQLVHCYLCQNNYHPMDLPLLQSAKQPTEFTSASSSVLFKEANAKMGSLQQDSHELIKTLMSLSSWQTTSGCILLKE